MIRFLRGLGAMACAALLVAGCGTREPDGPSAAESSSAVSAFLDGHWGERPIPLQGEPPAGWSPIETDLDPAACATCHRDRFEEWSGSLHAGAYSPGLEGQLAAWFESDPATVESCMACHAPLTEQLRRIPGTDGAWRENPAWDPELERAGVSCAACHVRGWRRYGPPRRDGSIAPAPDGTPHDGAVGDPAFESSEFCAPCHQFEDPAPGGKPLENTVAEWRASEWAERGVGCQSCHMPDRRHLWRGIHDPGTTRSGVTPGWTVEGSPGDGAFAVTLALANTGTGHHFPTYVTPAVDLEIAFLDSAGDTLGSKRRTLSRRVVFDEGAWVELADDRIPAGETRTLAWRGPAPVGATTVVGRIGVRPDAFYTEFFEELLAEADADHPGRPLLREALARTRESPYELWRRGTVLEPQ